MNFRLAHAQTLTRRHFLKNCQLGIGGMALGSLLGREGRAAPPSEVDPLAIRPPHFAPKAKRVIYLHLAGSPPHLDLFDYKPELVKHNGELCPDEFVKGKRFAFTSGTPKLMGTPHRFAQYGQAGVWMSDAIPHLTEVVDELAVIRSMNTDQFNHAPAELMLHTGSARLGRPSLGSWTVYGLGSESQNLPGFVVLVSSGSNPSAGKSVWGSGFLPSVFQGVQCRTQGEPVLYVTNPAGMDQSLRRASLDTLNELNRLQAAELGSQETLTRIAQYELAFRMQVAVPEVMDLSRETQATLDAYGAKPGAGSFANNCLMARRLAEQGVRFVQLFDWGWDFHGTRPDSSLGDGLRRKCEKMDRPVAALIKDLKARGMLNDTLVIWGGEFGRTPFREGRTATGANLGRDHYPDCFTMFMAGGGVKPGILYGETDELGFSVARDKVHVHDFQATVLHLLGFDHTRLTYPYQGRDFRLTDVYGEVVPALLA